MAIRLNGSANPYAVTINGTSLDHVYASKRGEIGFASLVWSRAAAGPETISVAAVTAANGNCIFFRNMQAEDSPVIVVGESETFEVMRYKGDITIETSFNSGMQIGPGLPLSDPYTWSPNESGMTYSFSGLSGYKLYDVIPTNANYTDLATRSLTFDVYQNESGYLRESDKVRMLLDTKLTIVGGRANNFTRLGIMFTTESTGRAWPCLTATSGYIYQGPGILDVIRA